MIYDAAIDELTQTIDLESKQKSDEAMYANDLAEVHAQTIDEVFAILDEEESPNITNWLGSLQTSGSGVTSALSTENSARSGRNSANTTTLNNLKATLKTERETKEAAADRLYRNTEQSAWNSYLTSVQSANTVYLGSIKTAENTYKTASDAAEATFDTTTITAYTNYHQSVHALDTAFYAAVADADDVNFTTTAYFTTTIANPNLSFQKTTFAKNASRGWYEGGWLETIWECTKAGVCSVPGSVVNLGKGVGNTVKEGWFYIQDTACVGTDAIVTGAGAITGHNWRIDYGERSLIGQANTPANADFGETSLTNALRSGLAGGTLGASEMAIGVYQFSQDGNAESLAQHMGGVALCDLVSALLFAKVRGGNTNINVGESLKTTWTNATSKLSTIAQNIKNITSKTQIPENVELFGGKTGQVPGALNIDVIAENGLRADITRPLVVTGQASEITAFNPYLEIGTRTTMQWLPNAARILKPGGRIIISGTKRNSCAQLPTAAELESIGLKLVDQFKGVPEKYRALEFRQTSGKKIYPDTMYTIILEKR